eukprot:CAMPEP_0172493222 /NCGR_PEP_ID=MMETSP1066-20121228/24585_1 /TAXON_ID=671091 /ORGANISM="Coscinodiscus wailesii, Strain CCMP2513" /LENGTH=519 /DNA_ID=CAMNT_0013263271 /DNA_START=203 /DNA_END=1762 /DNA_ORIENTATION=+
MKFSLSPHLLLLLLPYTHPFSPNIIVISPPGGVGEVATVSCAKKGAAVKWCVVSPADTTVVSLSEESLRSISAAGGAVDIVGSPASSLLDDDGGGGGRGSARDAIRVWSGSSDWGGIICTLDGSEGEGEVEDAVKVAVREVCSGSSAGGSSDAVKVVVMPEEGDDEEKEGGDGIWGLLNKKDVPGSITEAVGAGTVVRLRHAELFGIPESSKDASPFINGPRRSPILRDEYTQRSIRLTPVPLPRTRTSRLSLGDAAALLALRTLTPPTTTSSSAANIYLTSLVGSEEPTEEEWTAEYSKCNEQMTGSKLLRADLVVADVGRLSDWLATKWAPTILRTYDIAGIRVGERPVYASRVDDETVEIVWQQLVDFDSVTVGKMVIRVAEDGIVASRAAGDASKGYGSVKVGELQGETILVKSLGDAAAQAIEKGLAKKVKRAKPKKAKQETPVVAPTTSVVTSGATLPQEQAAAAVEKPSLESGPRSAGARRSARRTRGKRRKEEDAAASTTPSEDSTPESWQ